MPIFDDEGCRKIIKVVKRVLRTPEGERIDHGNRGGDILRVVKIVAGVPDKPATYYGKIFISPKTSLSGGLDETDLGTPPSDADCVVWNLPEIGRGNPLQPGDVYAGFHYSYDDDEELPVILIDSQHSSVLVRFDSAADGGGCYNGKVMVGASSVDSSSTDAEAMAYEMEAGADCYIINTDENGQDTHLIKVDGTAYAVGLMTGMTTGGVPVVMLESVQGATTGTETLDGASSTYNYDTRNWARFHTTSGDDLGGVPLTLKDYTRLYEKRSDPSIVTLKGFSRDLTVDAAGRMRQVSLETSHDVMRLPKFDVDSDCADWNWDTRTKYNACWAYDNDAQQWVPLCVNEVTLVTGVHWDSSAGTLYTQSTTLHGFFVTNPTLTRDDIGDYDDCTPS